MAKDSGEAPERGKVDFQLFPSFFVIFLHLFAGIQKTLNAHFGGVRDYPTTVGGNNGWRQAVHASRHCINTILAKPAEVPANPGSTLAYLRDWSASVHGLVTSIIPGGYTVLTPHFYPFRHRIYTASHWSFITLRYWRLAAGDDPVSIKTSNSQYLINWYIARAKHAFALEL